MSNNIMTPEEINEGNKLIAEFMGYKQYDGYNQWFKHGDYAIPDKKYSFKLHGDWEETDAYSLSSLKFHTSWDWLMPVVEKIESLGYHTRICLDDLGSWMQIHYGLSVRDTTETKAVNIGGTKIENTYKTIIQFIRWHNTQAK